MMQRSYVSCFPAFSEEECKAAAWAKAIAIRGSTDRIDCDGRVMRWSDYGQHSQFGWLTDRIMPEASGGTDHPLNLRARHWLGVLSACRIAREASDGRPGGWLTRAYYGLVDLLRA